MHFEKFQTFFTISAFPSAEANLVPAFTAGIMAKLIITWSTKCRTRGVEIIFGALHTNAMTKLRNEKSKSNANIYKNAHIAGGMRPLSLPCEFCVYLICSGHGVTVTAVALHQRSYRSQLAMDSAQTKFTNPVAIWLTTLL